MHGCTTGIALMGGREGVRSVEFWNSKPELLKRIGHEVRRVELLPNRVSQRHCEIRSLRLVLDDGSAHHVVTKDTTLHRGNFKNDVHYQRTARAYEVEIAFYERLAYRLRHSEAHTADYYYGSIHGDEIQLVLEDLSGQCDISSESCERECQKATLNAAEAKAALDWLAAFHAAYLDVDMTGVWPRGAYWSLEKRQKEWSEMIQEWQQTWENFVLYQPRLFQRTSVRRLASDLASVAEELDAALIPTPNIRTLLHGDFKTANLFFLSNGVAACDFQWTGPGLGVSDVIYLLYSSVQSDVIFSKEQELLYHYYQAFIKKAEERGFSLRRQYNWSEFERHAEIAYLDYVRFLIGSMWGSITPTTHLELHSTINLGMHRRNPDHLVKMVKKTEGLLTEYLQRRSLSVGAYV